VLPTSFFAWKSLNLVRPLASSEVCDDRSRPKRLSPGPPGLNAHALHRRPLIHAANPSTALALAAGLSQLPPGSHSPVSRPVAASMSASVRLDVSAAPPRQAADASASRRATRAHQAPPARIQVYPRVRRADSLTSETPLLRFAVPLQRSLAASRALLFRKMPTSRMRTRFDVQLLFGARASLKLASPRQPRPCGFPPSNADRCSSACGDS
jgi:hypothetical protein